MKKVAGNRELKLSGCTTDSGGGGTGHSLRKNMDKANLCIAENLYLVGFCCLHTLQLTLNGGLTDAIGEGGIEKRNAMQCIHAAYDLQNTLGFAMWKKYFEVAMKVVGGGDDDDYEVVKMSEPIVTRWWTVGNAAENLLKNLPAIQQIAIQARNVNPSGNKTNKIASRFLSLLKEPMILSDVKLIAGFHKSFLDNHFAWMQKGDIDIGNSPGFLGRHMLMRYFLMHTDLSKLLNEELWPNLMTAFSNSLTETSMNETMNDPTKEVDDATAMITKRQFQIRKAKMFFRASLTKLDKHYQRYCSDLFFLSLYGEKCCSQVVAKFLYGDIEDDNNDVNNDDDDNGEDCDHDHPRHDHDNNQSNDTIDLIVFPNEPAFSSIHQRNINMNGFLNFLQSKITTEEKERMKDECAHLKLIGLDEIKHLIGKIRFLIRHCFFLDYILLTHIHIV